MNDAHESVIAIASVRERPADNAWRKAIASLEDPPALPPEGREGLQAASRSGHEWAWVLDERTRPRPDALPRLLEAAKLGAGRGTTLTVAGMVVDEAGTPLESLLPAGLEHDTVRVLELAQRRLLPIRHATLANTLVHRDALVAHGTPRLDLGRYAQVEWTARIMRGSYGLFVPASLATAPEDLAKRESSRAAADVPALLRMYRTGTWTRGEAFRAAGRLARR